MIRQKSRYLWAKIAKQEVAFLRFTLEAHEGLVSFSTLASKDQANFSVLEIRVSNSQFEDARRVLSELPEVQILTDRSIVETLVNFPARLSYSL